MRLGCLGPALLLLAIPAGAALLAASAAEPDASPPPSPTPAASPAPTLAAQIQGRVIVERNDPVPGVTVIFRPQDGGSPVFLTSTDVKGIFRLRDVPAGVYHGELHREGLKAVVQDNYELKAPFRGVYEVRMTKDDGRSDVASTASPAAAPAPVPARLAGSGVSGVVRGADGKPLEEATVHLVRSDGSVEPRRYVTGRDGAFRAEALAPGRWEVTIGAPGWLSIRAVLDLRGDEGVVAILVAQPANYVSTPEDLMPPEEPIPPPAASTGQ